MHNDGESGQTRIAAQKNSDFFLGEYDKYKDNVSSIDTYGSIFSALNLALKGSRRVLDIGNGGVFDYDTALVEEIVGIDLFLDQLPKDVVLPPNVRMVQGDALAIPPDVGVFDTVVMVMLIHHLVGRTVENCFDNVRKSFTEAFAHLESGGRILVMDSCVPEWFFGFERLAFRPAAWVIERTIKHPPVLQYTTGQVKTLLNEAGFRNITVAPIPKGKFILQFGVKVPAALTPTQPTLFIAEK